MMKRNEANQTHRPAHKNRVGRRGRRNPALAGANRLTERTHGRSNFTRTEETPTLVPLPLVVREVTARMNRQLDAQPADAPAALVYAPAVAHAGAPAPAPAAPLDRRFVTAAL